MLTSFTVLQTHVSMLVCGTHNMLPMYACDLRGEGREVKKYDQQKPEREGRNKGRK